MIESDLLRVALEYAEAGIPVFPSEPDGKMPATERSYNDATTNHDQIREWWGEDPLYNIGLRPADAGWIVLDADMGKGVDRDLLARLPETFTVATPRGGRHLYFESAADHDNGTFDRHIYVHSADGYVLAPESIVGGKSYRVISNCGRLAPFPDWAIERLVRRARDNSNTEPPPRGEQAKAKRKGKSRFGGLSPSEGATLPPLSYWNEAKTLPRSNMGGCVGFLVGQYGSHKTGTAIMLALDAIQRHGARVLFIAAEDANGVAKTRLPAACKARGIKLVDIDAHWRTETETFDLLSESDRGEMFQAYREFAPGNRRLACSRRHSGRR